MRKLFPILLVIFFFPAICSGQWKQQIGINTLPLIARSVDVFTELNRHPGYSLIFNAGYTYRTKHIGLIDYDVDDGISKRRTSGAFVKAGGRLYLASLNGKQRRGNFFVGSQIIISQYKQTALRRQMDSEFNYTDDYTPLSSKGVIVRPAVSIGFTHRITENFALDWGVQKTFRVRRDDMIGLHSRNYQPGIGSGQSDPFLNYLQGILALKYTFH